MKRKPTRRDLLIIIGRLQDLNGQIRIVFHDRNPNREEDVQKLLTEQFQLCVEARNWDPPIMTDSGPWGKPGDS
jgi:hypothetical protein